MPAKWQSQPGLLGISVQLRGFRNNTWLLQWRNNGMPWKKFLGGGSCIALKIIVKFLELIFLLCCCCVLSCFGVWGVFLFVLFLLKCDCTNYTVIALLCQPCLLSWLSIKDQSNQVEKLRNAFKSSWCYYRINFGVFFGRELHWLWTLELCCSCCVKDVVICSACIFHSSSYFWCFQALKLALKLWCLHWLTHKWQFGKLEIATQLMNSLVLLKQAEV